MAELMNRILNMVLAINDQQSTRAASRARLLQEIAG
jgi:hypothetical protein